MFKFISALTLALLVSGCASVFNEKTHPMLIETMTTEGVLVASAACKASNDRGVVALKSGDTVEIRRSSRDLDITCTSPTHADAAARAVSRPNVAMWGNILLGGGVGAVVDHNRGTAYTYPTWVQLVFGQSLVFDRSSEEEGDPVPPRPISPAAAPRPRTGPR